MRASSSSAISPATSSLPHTTRSCSARCVRCHRTSPSRSAPAGAMGDPLDVDLARERIYLDGYLNLGLRNRSRSRGLLRTRCVRRRHLPRAQPRAPRSARRRGRRSSPASCASSCPPRALDLSCRPRRRGALLQLPDKATSTMLDLFKQTFGVELLPESLFTLSSGSGSTRAVARLGEPQTTSPRKEPPDAAVDYREASLRRARVPAAVG
jgi:hypothetical protein